MLHFLSMWLTIDEVLLNNSINTADGVMVIVHCTFSHSLDHCMKLYWIPTTSFQVMHWTKVPNGTYCRVIPAKFGYCAVFGFWGDLFKEIFDDPRQLMVEDHNSSPWALCSGELKSNDQNTSLWITSAMPTWLLRYLYFLKRKSRAKKGHNCIKNNLLWPKLN
jgi:hypothetical protein